MKIYTRYSYWFRKNTIIKNRHSWCNPAEAGDKFLGLWYAHEQQPCFDADGNIVRYRYGKKVVLREAESPNERG